MAQRANVGLLALTHLSNRYFGQEIAREAREIFPDTIVPKDFDLVEVPFAERGMPQLVKGGALHRPEPEAVSSAPK
jgi:ribonuclease Z